MLNMRRVGTVLLVLVWGVLLPSAVFAQAGITGNVKDASGAVLPGVTVEASSPALIQKVRSVVTDGAGNYRIEDLRPGSYSVVFTLTGFSTVKRDGIELTGSFVATVDGELRVGSVEETITVTGEAPQVDVTTATRQRVLNDEVLNAIPTGRSYYSVANLIAGTRGNINDPGQIAGGGMSAVSIHGGRTGDQRVMANGLNFNTSIQDGNNGGNIPNQSAVQEFAIDTDAQTAERDTSGVQINIIFKEGGNKFSSYNFFTWGGEQTAADNLTDRLRRGPYGRPGVTDAPGLLAVNSTKATWEINPSLGGPIMRDKLWFHYAFRYQRSEIWSAGMYYNKNQFDPAKWTYDPDLNRPSLSRDAWHDSSQIRLTWQATPKNKIALAWDLQNSCECPTPVSAYAPPAPLVAPESMGDRRFPHEQTYRAEWTSPVSNRLLLEARAMRRTEHWGFMHLRPSNTSKMWPFRGGSFDRTFPMEAYPIYFTLHPMQEQNSVNGMLPNLVYRGPRTAAGGNQPFFNRTDPPGWYTQTAASYITGSHTFKVGYTGTIGYSLNRQYTAEPGGSIQIRARSPVGADGRILAPDGLPTPNQITLLASPVVSQTNLDCTCGIYAQDKWTVDRWTFNYGVRFDWFRNSYDDVTLPASPLFIGTSFARGVDQRLPGGDNLFWKDISPRFGAAWDVMGDGRTAVKVSVGEYVQSFAGTAFTDTNPVTRLVNIASRTWNDANRDMRIDCNYLNPAANGECAAFTGDFVNFGTLVPRAVPDTTFLKGWGIRPGNWQFSAGLQRELMAGVSADVSYFRRIATNFTTSVNRAYDGTCGTAGDHRGCFTEFSVIAPTDARLGDTSGTAIGGNYDVLPQYVTLAPRNVTTLVKDLQGSPTQREHWNGVDVNVNARLPRGIMAQAGASTGRASFDNCELVQNFPETRGTAPASPAAFCQNAEPWLVNFKGFGSYTVPKLDVQVSAFYQNVPGAGARQARYILSNANVAANSTLGRPLTAAGGQQTINLLSPGTEMWQERLNELDLRLGKIIRQGANRFNLALDVFNVFNADMITQESFEYDTLFRPTNVLQSRFAKFTVQFEF